MQSPLTNSEKADAYSLGGPAQVSVCSCSSYHVFISPVTPDRIRTMRRYSRKLRSTPAVVLFFVIFVFLLPYDSQFSLRAAIVRAVPALFERRWWLINKPSAYPVDFSQDVAVLVKSGIGTKERIPAWLKAHEHMGLSDLLLIGDFATLPGQEYQYRDRRLPIHDVLGWMIGKGYLAGELDHPRLEKYYNLTRAVDRGDVDAAREMSGAFGWELDAMKVPTSYLCMREGSANGVVSFWSGTSLQPISG